MATSMQIRLRQECLGERRACLEYYIRRLDVQEAQRHRDSKGVRDSAPFILNTAIRGHTEHQSDQREHGLHGALAFTVRVNTRNHAKPCLDLW